MLCQRTRDTKKMPKVRFKFEPHDLWVGVYWKMTRNVRPAADFLSGYAWDFHARGWLLDVYICPLPTLLIHLQFYKERKR